MHDKLTAGDATAARLLMAGILGEGVSAHGEFFMEHIRDGKVIAREYFLNTVVTVGKNALLDAGLAGAAYTVTGPFMGLISSASFAGVAAGDTMGSHAGWLEAGLANAPTYSGTRKTAAWSAATSGAKALSAALNFAFTGSGTVKGAFLAFGTGAVATIDNAAGTLFSAGLFSGGDRAVVNTDQLNISYTVTLS
jgi:hypothetical protein